jgi:CcmD family protein
LDESKKFWYLFIAYTIIWLLIGGYILWLGLRQRRNRHEIDRLRAKLGHDDDVSAGPTPPRAR